MKTVRHYLAFALRFVGYIFSLPTALLNTLSDLIKNDDDEFNF